MAREGTDTVARIGDNSLPALAESIRRDHAEVERCKQTGCEHAIRAGNALIEAKGAVKRGAWLAFVASCGVPRSTAKAYMQVARMANAVGHLSFRKAVKALAEPKITRDADVLPFPADRVTNQPRAKRKAKPRGESHTKGRARAVKREPGAPVPRQPRFVEAPRYFEEALLAIELCTSHYAFPDIDAVLQTAIKQRIGRAKLDEFIAYLSRLRDALGEEAK